MRFVVAIGIILYAFLSGKETAGKLRLCNLYEDTYGEWFETLQNSDVNQTRVLNHFLGGSPGEAMWFHKVYFEISYTEIYSCKFLT